ncbi:MAG: hypothetical protein JW841_16990 [Deltaproteobacteria bacterium]|nr:hypothetical protein [Deltaproteobacteria bacterium]
MLVAAKAMGGNVAIVVDSRSIINTNTMIVPVGNFYIANTATNETSDMVFHAIILRDP